MRRAPLVATIGAALCGLTLPVRLAAATTLQAALAATDSSTLVPVAQAFGFLDRVGLAVDPQMLANGSATVAALIGGSIDIGGSNSLSFLQARAKGLPLKIVAAQAIYRTGSASTALVVNAASPLRTGSDLRGKIVAVNALGGTPHIAVEAWIDKNGGDAKATRFVEMTFPAMPAALAAQRVDAAMIAEPALTAALASGRILADAYGAIGPLWLSDAIVATEAWIEAHADDAQRLAQALRATAIWANRNHAKTAAITAQVLKLDPAVVRTMRRAVFAETVSPQLLQPVIDAGMTYGALNASVAASDAFSRYALAPA